MGGQMTTGRISSWRITVWIAGCVATLVLSTVARAADPSEEAPPAVADTPAVAAIRDANPTTPEQLLRAVSLLIQLERSDLARTYLEQLQNLNLDDAAKAQLQEQFGSGMLIRLSRQKELGPEGAQFVLSVLEAARRQATDPQRLAQLVTQLGGDSRQGRYEAAEQLVRAGQYAVPPLLTGIIQNPSPTLEQAGSAIIAELAAAAVPPLAAFLSSPDGQQRAVAAKLLGYTKSSDAMPYLVRPYFAADPDAPEQAAASTAWQLVADQLPQRPAALQILRGAAERAYAGQPPGPVDDEEKLLWWTWSAESQSAVANRILGRDAAALVAARHYADLARLLPDAVADRRRELVARLHADQALGGLGQPLRRGEGSAYQRASEAGAEVVQAVLAEALDAADLPAAIGAAEVLGALGDRSVLQSHQEHLAPLIEALNHPSRRVRFAAARAIGQLEPEAPFAGLSRWAEVLGDCAGAQGKRVVLAAHPRRAVAQTLGGTLATAGFEVLTATTGAEMIRRAVPATDLELVLVSDRINPESLWSWLEELRADPYTAELPVAIVASPGMLTAARRVAEAHSRVLAVPETTDAETMLSYLPRLREMAGREWVDQDERLQQAQVALDALQQLLRPELGAALDLSRQQTPLLAALNTPESSAGAARILARIATPQAQQALLDYASLITWPLESRKAAATAFAESVDAFGVLLTSEQRQQQYERYNQSRPLDAETQQVLSGLLDVMEASKNVESDSPSPQP